MTAGGAQLYAAGGKLKDLLRGRAILLVADRPDIADAVQADGIVLSPQGRCYLCGQDHLEAGPQLLEQRRTAAN